MPEISLDEAAEIRDRALAPWVAKLELRIEHVGADGMRLRLPSHADLVQEAARSAVRR